MASGDRGDLTERQFILVFSSIWLKTECHPLWNVDYKHGGFL